MFCGIDIGGTKCSVCIGSAEKGITDKITFKTTDVDETIKNIINSVDRLGCQKAIGISCGGPLDSKKGIILSPPNLRGWDNIKIVDMLEEKFRVPCGIHNDANACAMAEWKYGAGKGTQNMIFLTFGTGMGAGLILNGQLYEGTNDMAGEIGHIRLSPFGPIGYGKGGSFEGFCSGGGIAMLGKMIAIEQLQAGKPASFCKSYDELGKISAKSIAESAKKGNADALKVYEICAEKLGMGISILIDILNPEKIVIGSVFQRSGELMIDKMNEIIRSETLIYSREVCSVVPAKLGDDIGDYAALAVAEQTYFGRKK